MSNYETLSSVNSSERLDMVFTIVPRGKGEDVLDIFRENNLINSIICHGRGTAPSKVLEMLGLGATEKDVVISFIKNEQNEYMLKEISRKMEFAKPGRGISFTVPLQSVAGIMAFKLLTTDHSEEDD